MVHKQLAEPVAKAYDLLMLPSFEASAVIRKADGQIIKTARQMVTMGALATSRTYFKCCPCGCKITLVNEA